MRPTRRQLMQGIGAAFALRPAAAQPQQNRDGALTLWYRSPANEWTEALPIGNGVLGAMVFGGVEHERLQLNEHTLWSGHHVEDDNADAREAVQKIRQLLFEGKYAEANSMGRPPGPPPSAAGKAAP